MTNTPPGRRGVQAGRAKPKDGHGRVPNERDLVRIGESSFPLLATAARSGAPAKGGVARLNSAVDSPTQAKGRLEWALRALCMLFRIMLSSCCDHLRRPAFNE